ncbi:26S protease regulatory subunit 7 [Capsicum chinense]|nr:26S protease regulatory subunit 7 [Capsicum chinense]
MWVNISIVDELMQPLMDKAMLSGYNCREEWIPAMVIKEKPNVTYNDMGGCKEQIDKMQEVLPEFFRVEVFAKLNSAIGKLEGAHFKPSSIMDDISRKNLQVHAEQVKPLEEYYMKQRKLLDFQVAEGPVETLQGLLVTLHLQHKDVVSSAQLTAG